MTPLLPLSAARVFCDGMFGMPRLSHPEGIAIHPGDGSVWCGTENGDLLRIAPDGSSYESMGSTGGFVLGLAFDRDGTCYACDLAHKAIFRRDARTGCVERFAASGIRVPNYPVVDEVRRCLWVSDSRGEGDLGRGLFRFDLHTGEGGPSSAEADWNFANGLCLDEEGEGLYVVESDAARVRHVPIRPDGTLGPAQVALEGLARVPDGLALSPEGFLYISCYEPSRIYRRRPNRRGVDLLIEDPRATLLAHPTNIALKDDRLYATNLGRWHITEITLG